MTGSSLPWRARSVRSRPNALIVGVLTCRPFSPDDFGTPSSSSGSRGSPSGASSPPVPWVPAARNFSTVTPALKRSWAAAFSPSFSMAVTRWTVPIALPLPASSSARPITFLVRAVSGSCPRVCTEDEAPAIIVFIDSARSAMARPRRPRRTQAWHFGIARMDRKMCSAPMWSWPS